LGHEILCLLIYPYKLKDEKDSLKMFTFYNFIQFVDFWIKIVSLEAKTMRDNVIMWR
jgi:hypothetical protein